MIEPDEYTYFCERALNGMSRIVGDLGDDLANQKPSLPGANSPFALLTHCLGVVDTWAGYFVAGRPNDRDRGKEFEASGPVAPLLERVDAVVLQLREDAHHANFRAPLRVVPPDAFEGPDRALSQGGALQHVYEELAQHHGQMELMRDVIIAEATGSLVAAR